MPGSSRLARLLQLMCFAQLLAAAGWLAWRWSASPWQAVGGAVAVLAIAPLVLGIELLIQSRVSRSDSAVPHATWRQLVGAWLSESVHWFRTFCWRQPFRWREMDDHLAGDSSERVGVVLVHGFLCNRGFWTPWMRELRKRGHAYAAVNLEPVFCSIDDYAEIIDAAVRRVTQSTGRPPVIVCHSMGGLVVRAWWRLTSGTRAVARLVTIGSPHQGTWLARFSRQPNGRQMQLQCAWLGGLGSGEAQLPLPRTTCWYSNCDNVVFPASSSMLPGADNRFVPGPGHVGLAFDPRVMLGTLDLLARTQQHRQGESVTGFATENR